MAGLFAWGTESVGQVVGGKNSPAETLSTEQALLKLKSFGGILIHYDDRLPGTPVTMIDAAGLEHFQDDWTRFFAFFPSLRQVSLSGTPVSDAGIDELAKISGLEYLSLANTKVTNIGLAKLAKCKNLRYLDLEGTRVTQAGLIAIRQALPQLKLNARPEKVGTDNVWLDGRPIVSFVDRIPRNSHNDAGDETVLQFSASEIDQWRKKLNALSQLPEETPDGWSKSRIDPARMLSVFPKLRLRDGHVLRAYVFKEDANTNGFVWALPADADFPEPADCPRIESHFLKPPKPWDALDDLMEAITGDDSPQSYLHASILRREFKEFNAGWHGIRWGMNVVLDDTPWNQRQRSEENPIALYPESKAEEWMWNVPKPTNWRPEVRMSKDKAVVTFYSYTGLATELENGTEEKERIILHTETYRRGKYRPLIVEKKVAEGPLAYAH
ncbi:MAG TPA: hypothetical protein DDZ51_11185 [Planctomycetaceae bacterium]|nr:hypothetical protein [Planctomycetaceae bacterium]